MFSQALLRITRRSALVELTESRKNFKDRLTPLPFMMKATSQRDPDNLQSPKLLNVSAQRTAGGWQNLGIESLII